MQSANFAAPRVWRFAVEPAFSQLENFMPSQECPVKTSRPACRKSILPGTAELTASTVSERSATRPEATALDRSFGSDACLRG